MGLLTGTGWRKRRPLQVLLRSGFFTGCLLFLLSACSDITAPIQVQETRNPTPAPAEIPTSISDVEPTNQPVDTAEVEYKLALFHEDSVQIHSLDGVQTDSWEITGQISDQRCHFQVVGEKVYYLDQELQTVVVVNEIGTYPLQYTSDPNLAGFLVSEDESKIVWVLKSGSSNYELWMASVSGTNQRRLAIPEPASSASVKLQLEPYQFTNSAGLVYTWQYATSSSVRPFDSYSSFYLFDLAENTARVLISLSGFEEAPCWDELSADLEFVAGVCGSTPLQSRMRVRMIGSEEEEIIPALENQVQVGAAAFSPDHTQLAFSVVRGSALAGTGRLVLQSFPGRYPLVLVELEDSWFDHLEWIGGGLIAVQAYHFRGPVVYLVSTAGDVQQVGEGLLLGILREER